MAPKSWILKFMSLWPPYLGSGVRVKRISPDFRVIEVEMKLHWWNQNYVGTHFGGSLYAMTDPFLMLMLLQNLGSNYIVWDKAASIRFRKPGRGRVRVRFELSGQEIESIRAQADRDSKVEPTFQVRVLNDSDETVAEVEKVLHVRRKAAKRD